MKKIIICLVLTAVFLLSGCDDKLKVEQNDKGFYDEDNNIQYVACSEFAVRPLEVGEEYAADGDNTYYKIPWQEPKEFLCDNIEGISFVYRASNIEDITINSFKPISALVYLSDSLYVSTLYCEQKYLTEELQSENARDDSEIIYSIRDALVDGERVTVAENKISYEDEFYIRLLSAKYPGLYYTVIFFTDVDGKAYLKDRGTGECVLAPENVIIRMIGLNETHNNTSA